LLSIASLFASFVPCSPCCHCDAQEIAREKAGILKPGAPALTVPQPPDAMAALQVRCTLACRMLDLGHKPAYAPCTPTHAGGKIMVFDVWCLWW
jgi:hypothetical protein